MPSPGSAVELPLQFGTSHPTESGRAVLELRFQANPTTIERPLWSRTKGGESVVNPAILPAGAVGDLDCVRAGAFVLVVSDVTLDELELAPERVRRILAEIDDSRVEQVETTPESEALARQYLDAKVVGPSCVDDARHIAVATIMDVDIVASWNFKHIVHFEKIMGFEGINLTKGYRSPRIYSPRELVEL